MLTFGDVLRCHRLSAGLSQEALAERAGLSPRGISDLERGARRAPYRNTVLRLAEALDLGDSDRSVLLAASRRQRAGTPAVVPEPSTTVLAVPLSSSLGREHEQFHSRRHALGRSQAQLGAALGVSARTVTRWERRVIAVGHPDLLQLAPQRLEGARQASPMSEPVPDANRVVGGTNVPACPTPLIGRQTALRELRTLLSKTRLLTLVGPGGVGKTRLALELASVACADFSDGMVFVDLSAARDADLVVPLIAQVLDVRDMGGVGLQSALVRGIGSRQLLLVLDNFEQVVEAASHVAALLQACPGLNIVVTSREPLRLSWERRYAVLPLEVPTASAAAPNELAAVPAVTLFVQSAQAVQSTFALDAHNAAAVSQLCAQLDGLPLAIELAAAHVVAFPPGLMVQRLERRLDLLRGLRDQPARHASLRAALDWSHALLGPEEQVLFRRLSVFARGWTLEAAEAVCAGGVLDQSAVLEMLARLVERSLVLLEQDGADVRYRLLETLREYAAEQLVTTEQDAEVVRRSHRDWYLALAEAAAAEMVGQHQAVWIRHVDAEHDNLRAALHWTLERGEAELGLRLAGAVWRFWWMHGHRSEGRRWLDRLLAVAASGGTTLAALRAKALDGAGVLAAEQSDYGRATALWEESLGVFRDLGDKRGIAWSFNDLARVASDQGEYGRASALAEESLALFRERGDRRGMAMGMEGLAAVAGAQDEPERAARLLGAAQALREAVNAPVAPVERAPYDRSIAAVRARLGEGAFAAAWAAGRAMTPEQAINAAAGGCQQGDQPAPTLG